MSNEPITFRRTSNDTLTANTDAGVFTIFASSPGCGANKAWGIKHTTHDGQHKLIAARRNADRGLFLFLRDAKQHVITICSK